MAGTAEAAARRPSRAGAFRYRNYRLFWFGLFAMVMGENARWLAQGYLIQTLTGKPIYLGLAGLATSLPNIALSFLGGAVADRVDRRRVIMVTSGTSACLTLLIGVLAITHLIAVWHVLAVAVALGTVFAFDTPARQALLPHLVGREEMASAVALNTAVWQSNRIVGPIVAGLLIAFAGVGFSYLVTAAGYLIALVLVSRLSLSAAATPTSHGSVAANIREGLGFIARNGLFAGMMGLSFMTSLFGYSYVTLLPVFALEILDVGALGFSMMETAAGVGAIVGTLAVAYFRLLPRNGKTLFAGAVAFGLLLVGFSLSRLMPVTLALLFVAGLANAVYLNLALTTLQLRVPDALRGRVMAVWGLTWVFTPMGGFVAGSVAQLAGAPVAVAVGGAAVSLFALVIFARVPVLRRM